MEFIRNIYTILFARKKGKKKDRKRIEKKKEREKVRGRNITMTKLCDRSDSMDRVRKYTPSRVPWRPEKNYVIT